MYKSKGKKKKRGSGVKSIVPASVGKVEVVLYNNDEKLMAKILCTSPSDAGDLLANIMGLTTVK